MYQDLIRNELETAQKALADFWLIRRILSRLNRLQN